MIKPADEAIRTFETSHRLIAEAREWLPGGASSDYRLGPTALVFERGDGPYLYDVDGNRLVDYFCGAGPVILGHNPPAVVEAVTRRIADGVILGGETRDEFEAARLVTEMIPCAERARFGNTGSEIVALALRVARAATGRWPVVKLQGHYHGWFDPMFIGLSARADRPDPPSGLERRPSTDGQDPGAFEHTDIVPWNDLPALTARLERGDVAALIMEPLWRGYVAPSPGYLDGVRDLCTRTGTILIFDEIVSGFRVGPGGAQELFGVTPDLATFAKAIANGFPASCLAGRSDLLDQMGGGPVVHPGTYNGNALSMAATVATLGILKSGAPYEAIERAGGRLISGFSSLLQMKGERAIVQGVPGSFNIHFGIDEPISRFDQTLAVDQDRVMRLVLGLQDRGVRAIAGGHFYVNAAHTDLEVDATLNAFEDTLAAL